MLSMSSPRFITTAADKAHGGRRPPHSTRCRAKTIGTKPCRDQSSRRCRGRSCRRATGMSRASADNDVEVLDELFHVHDTTLRFGPAEAQYGYDQIASMRANRIAPGHARFCQQLSPRMAATMAPQTASSAVHPTRASGGSRRRGCARPTAGESWQRMCLGRTRRMKCASGSCS